MPRHPRNRAIFILVLLLSLNAIAVRADDQLSGPVTISNMYPLHNTHLSLRPESAEVVESGSIVARVTGTFTNTFVLKDDYVVDDEGHAASFEVRGGLDNGWDAGARTSLEWRGEGGMDRLIRNWHDTFHLPKGKRERVPDDQYEIDGVRQQGGFFSFPDQGYSLGLSTLSLHKELPHQNSSFHVTLLGELTLPTARDTFGSNGIDGSFGALVSKGDGSWRWHGGGGVLWFGDDSVDGVEYYPVHPEGFGGVEYRFSDRFSLSATVYGGGWQVQNVATHPNYFIYLDLGAKIRVLKSLVLELAMRENPAPGSGTSDISLIAGLSQKFQI